MTNNCRKLGIALGSNIGDREANIHSAIKSLDELRCSEHLLLSSIHETEPVACPPGSPSFLNAVLEIDSALKPSDILAHCQRIEKKLGRPESRPKNAPRSIDLDILYLGNLVSDSPDLILPHPDLHLRLFVLEPLSEIRPELLLPNQVKTVLELKNDQLRRLASSST